MAGTKRTRNKVTDAAKPDSPKANKAKGKAAKVDKKADKTKKRDAKDQAKKKDDVVDTQTPAQNKSDSEEDKKNIVEREAKISNGVIVDHKVPNPTNYEVVKSNGVILNCNMVFADCGNNNNKFYIIQGLKSGNSYYLWTRWGRVGVDGQTSLAPWGNESNLYSQYLKKSREKKSKGYNEIEISYEDLDETKKKLDKLEEGKKDKPAKKKKESQLPDSVQNLLRFIFDMKMIESSVVKVGYNIKKMPLGKLSKKTILEGYSVLQEIEKALDANKPSTELGRLSSEFYRCIPHDFGFKHMSNFIINTKDKLKEKLELVQALGDIQIAAEIINKCDEENDDTNELDARYKQMHWTIEPLDPKTQEYKDLLKWVETTHGSTHHFGIKTTEIFKIVREGEKDRFNEKIGNRKLLWHGSRFSNWGGILSQGLRIAPPEAPVTGYMFGKGVYFADVVSKSAQYCCSYLSNNEGLLALWDVAIGDHNDKKQADYNAGNLPKGKSSTKGWGRWVPTTEVQIDGINAYHGPLKDLGNGYGLYYNEFITYAVENVQIKYLFRCNIG